jgi:hypothetical protein
MCQNLFSKEMLISLFLKYELLYREEKVNKAPNPLFFKITANEFAV